MTLGRLSQLIKRARYRYRTEGLISLLRRSLVFVVRSIFVYETYCLNAVDSRGYPELDKADYTHKLGKLTSVTVTTNQEAEELEARGFKFFSPIENYGEWLENGAVAFCTFVGTELACISWAATSEKAMRSICSFPIKVNFDRSEAYGGRIVTYPKYRGMGLMKYNSAARLKFFADRGMVRVVGVIDKRNVSSLRGLTKIGSSTYAEARQLKILGLRFWKEKPLKQNVA